MLLDSTELSFDDVPCGADVRFVILLRLQCLARSLAVPDVVLKANLKLSFIDVLFAKIVFTSACGIHLTNQFKNSLHGLYVGVRTVVLAAVSDDVAQTINPRKAFFTDGDVGVTFIVFEIDIVARLMLFNKVIF